MSTTTASRDLDGLTRALHLGLMVFGVLALVTDLAAGDYKHGYHAGFTLHRWLGLAASLSVFFRLWYGFYGPREAQFRSWLPCTRERLGLVGEDLLHLTRGKLPDRASHQGLAGLVQAVGLAAFSWMAVTGTLLFVFLTPGHKARGLLHGLKESHEAGLWFCLVFLGIHVGAVFLHALQGNPLWRRAFFLEK